MTVLQLRRGRTRCCGCRAIQVFLPGPVLPLRADTTALIGTALLASAGAEDHRRIAAELGRLSATVRGWVRGRARRAH